MSIQGSRPPQDRGLAPNLIVRGVAHAIEFYRQALGAEVVYEGAMPNGVTLHAQLRIGNAYVLLSDEMMCREGGPPTGSPLKLGSASAVLELWVDDVDAAFDRAIKAGGKALGSVDMVFYGDRVGMFVDPFGHVWTLSTPIEVLTPQEVFQRMLQHFKTA
jgi:PhnB protein